MMKTKTLNQVLTYSILIIIAILAIFPLLWLFTTAFKSPSEDLFTFQLIPEKPTLENFQLLWQNNPVGRYLLNSTIVAFITVVINLFFCALAAYPLARLDFKGKDLIFALIVSSIIIPFQIVMIPLFIITVKLGLRNTYLGVILPNLATAFGIFLLRQAFAEVPKELEEAGRLDGCSELGLWWNIMIPAIRPSLITLAIFVFIGSWSDFLWPLIVLDPGSDSMTLPVFLSTIADPRSIDWRQAAAGSVISIVPVSVLFVFVQQYIIPTNIGSGVKG